MCAFAYVITCQMAPPARGLFDYRISMHLLRERRRTLDLQLVESHTHTLAEVAQACALVGGGRHWTLFSVSHQWPSDDDDHDDGLSC